jgi:hypothetical protein
MKTSSDRRWLRIREHGNEVMAIDCFILSLDGADCMRLILVKLETSE